MNIKLCMWIDYEYIYKSCVKYYLEVGNHTLCQGAETLRLCMTYNFNINQHTDINNNFF